MLLLNRGRGRRHRTRRLRLDGRGRRLMLNGRLLHRSRCRRLVLLLDRSRCLTLHRGRLRCLMLLLAAGARLRMLLTLLQAALFLLGQRRICLCQDQRASDDGPCDRILDLGNVRNNQTRQYCSGQNNGLNGFHC
jgi:hypothetical protein